LVKVVLCDRCIKKLMYKRTKDKEAAQAAAASRILGRATLRSGTDAADEIPEDISGSHGRKTSRETAGTIQRQRETRSVDEIALDLVPLEIGTVANAEGVGGRDRRFVVVAFIPKQSAYNV
jgi:hypothetical protein